MLQELAAHLKEKKQSVAKQITEVIPLGASDWFQLASDKAMSSPDPLSPRPDPEEPITGELESVKQSQVC